MNSVWPFVSKYRRRLGDAKHCCKASRGFLLSVTIEGVRKTRVRFWFFCSIYVLEMLRNTITKKRHWLGVLDGFTSDVVRHRSQETRMQQIVEQQLEVALVMTGAVFRVAAPVSR